MVCVCVCGFVVVEVAGSSGFLMGFVFFFFVVMLVFFFFFNMGFCSGGILVSSGQWWLGFFWVFVPLGFSGLIINDFWIFLTAGFFWVDHWLQLV